MGRNYLKFAKILLVLIALSSLAFADLIKLKNLKVVKVVDGDTIHVIINDNQESVRLIGINTTELKHKNNPAQAYSSEAKEALEKFLGNDNVTIVFDSKNMRDKYDRFLANVYRSADEALAQKYLLENGYAYTYIFSDDNFNHADEFYKYEDSARANKLGLWKLKDYQFISPVEAENEPLDSRVFVEGVVKNVSVSDKGIWLNFGESKKDFSAYLKLNMVKNPSEVISLKGKKVRVRGNIKKYNGSSVVYLLSFKAVQVYKTK